MQAPVSLLYTDGRFGQRRDLSALSYAFGATHRSIRAMPVFWLGTKRGTRDMATMKASTCPQQPPHHQQRFNGDRAHLFKVSYKSPSATPPANSILPGSMANRLPIGRLSDPVADLALSKELVCSTPRMHADHFSYPFDSLDIFVHLLIYLRPSPPPEVSQL